MTKCSNLAHSSLPVPSVFFVGGGGGGQSPTYGNFVPIFVKNSIGYYTNLAITLDE